MKIEYDETRDALKIDGIDAFSGDYLRTTWKTHQFKSKIGIRLTDTETTVCVDLYRKHPELRKLVESFFLW